MSRTARLLTCLLLILALAAAPAAFASPTDNAPMSCWTALSDLWSRVVAVAFGAEDPPDMGLEVHSNGLTVYPNDDTGAGPEVDPDGDGLTDSDAEGDRGPEIDPNG